MSLKTAVIASAALVLAGCSLLEPPGPQISARDPEPEGVYTKLIADHWLVKSFRLKTPPPPLEISALRPTVAPQLGDWVTCLRTWEDGKPVYYGVFLKDRAISDVRMAVVIDRCEEEQFRPMLP